MSSRDCTWNSVVPGAATVACRLDVRVVVGGGGKVIVDGI